MTISPERERQLLASCVNAQDSLRAIQFLLGRVKELEDYAQELEDREAELTATIEKLRRCSP